MKAKRIVNNSKLTFYSVDLSTHVEFQLIETIKAGFPSPADDFIELPLDLNKALIKNPSATFFAKVLGNSMQDAHINDGDILIIDRSIKPANGKIAVCFINGEFTVKKLLIKKNEIYLIPENETYKPIKVTPNDEFMVWGIVTHIIKKV